MKYANLQQPQNKLLGLEILRFFSALSILIWHYQHFFYIGKNIYLDKTQQPFYDLFFIFYQYGYLGVQIFWGVSGYIFFYKYKEAIANKIMTFNHFTMLRFSRLYPLHFVTLLLVAILQTLYFMKTNVYFVFQNNDIFHFVLQLFFASGWGIDNSASFNQPIWSISVEIIVYLIFFLILRFVSQSILSCLAIILLCLIAQLNHITSWIIDCLALFYLGGFTACVASDLEKTKHSSSVYVLASGVLFVTPILLLAIHGQWIRYNIYIEYIYVGVLLFVMGKKINFNFTIEKMISNMGNMTYSSYLIHFPLQLLITLLYLFLHKNIPYYNKTFFIGFIIGTFVLAHYIYKWFELPMQNYIRRNYYLKNTSPSIESNVFVR